MVDHHFTGRHVFAEFYGVKEKFLISSRNFVDIFRCAILESKATLCDLSYKDFDPAGFTILGLLSESHSSVHTYPEHQSLFIDAFTCGEHCSPFNIVRTLEAALAPKHVTMTSILRGHQGNQFPNIIGPMSLPTPNYA